MGALLRLGGTDPGETVGEIAYARIRSDILFGHLGPGEKLRLDAAGQRYGASVGTMRELLSRLVSEGLVVAEGQRGFQVAPVSASEFREIGALRLLLETHALTHSFRLGDLDWEARVVAAHHKLAVTESRMLDAGEGDAMLWKRCDREFHHTLISACGSRALLATHSSAYDKYLRYQMIAVIFRGEVAAREHGELVRCALARDDARAGIILREHIESCVDHALRDEPPVWETASRRPRSDAVREPVRRPLPSVPTGRAGRRPAR